MYKQKKVLLLDMNSTFMFGEDRFGQDEDYSLYYRKIGGSLSEHEINKLITDVYQYLEVRYTDITYRENFPSVIYAINEVSDKELSQRDLTKVIDTFAFHERGHISSEYLELIAQLSKQYTLAVVADIWAPKGAWLETFDELGLMEHFSVCSFSSDHGIVKPSPRSFELVVEQLGVPKNDCLVIGDSVRRDLGGARAAGIDCVLVGEANDAAAVASYKSLLAAGDDLL